MTGGPVRRDAPDSVAAFYDSLADRYHLIFEDWDRSMERQADALEGVFRHHAPSAGSVLDCTCGIGTQALGLARRGFRVTGSDVSVRSLQRARTEASQRGLSIALFAADVRRLPVRDGSFDIVAALDNALPHLVDERELAVAVANMARACRSGGVVLASLRDYAPLLDRRPGHDPLRVWGEPGGRRVTFQLWSWRDERRYDLLHVIGTEGACGEWRFETRETTYRAVLPRELSGLFGAAGLAPVEVVDPTSSGYYQPLVIGSKP